MADEEQIDETTTEEAPAEEAPAEAPPATVATEAAEPQSALSSKERRRVKRSAHHGPQGQELSLEQRIEERREARAAKARARKRRRDGERAERGEPGTGTAPADHVDGNRKIRQGRVISAKADKTITVKIEVVRRHRTYEKVVRQSATLRAHDELNDAHEGDVVRVIEARPLSKTKRWRLVEVVERAR